MADKLDLYAELGVARDATEEQIRSAYRKLARTYHPDVNPGKPEAEDKFKRVAAAYEVLANKEKRALYDEFGDVSRASGFDAEKARAYERYHSARAAAPDVGGEVPFDFDLGDLFGAMGARRGGRRTAAHDESFPVAGENLVAEVELDFVTALRGTELELDVPSRSPCAHCTGSGEEPGAKAERCVTCSGTGRVQAVHGPMRMTTPCPDCGGDGKLRTPCGVCRGAGIIAGTTHTRVRVPRGADDGSELRVRGKGTPGLFGGETGDLIIRTRVRPHPLFRRDGLDLSLELPVTLLEAYRGASVSVPTPDGPVQLKVPAHAQTGTQLRLRGKGVTRGDSHGDLYVKLVVRMPDDERPELDALLEQTAQYYTRDVREEVKL
jgi:molecular chaperone DnaJ